MYVRLSLLLSLILYQLLFYVCVCVCVFALLSGLISIPHTHISLIHCRVSTCVVYIGFAINWNLKM